MWNQKLPCRPKLEDPIVIPPLRSRLKLPKLSRYRDPDRVAIPKKLMLALADSDQSPALGFPTEMVRLALKLMTLSSSTLPLRLR